MQPAPASPATVDSVQIADGTKTASSPTNTNPGVPETVAGTVREYTNFTVGEVLEVKGAKLKVHDVTDQRLVLKFVHKQR